VIAETRQVARAKRRLLCAELDRLPRGRAAPQTRELLRLEACVHARTRARRAKTPWTSRAGQPASRAPCGISYEFDEIEQALAHLELASSSVNEYAHADAVIVAYLTQARIQHLRHDESGALAMLREGQELGERRGWRRVTLSLAAEECRSLARAGHHEEARLVATRFDFHELPPRSGRSTAEFRQGIARSLALPAQAIAESRCRGAGCCDRE
jgi:hypothetical protein